MPGWRQNSSCSSRMRTARRPRRHTMSAAISILHRRILEDARRAMVDTLEQMGFEVEAAHHEVAHGQHEIDFRYADALKTADNIATFRFVVKHVATQFGQIGRASCR